ncbi:MAG: Uma2 family endonuclease [Acidobacteria bacterium]|nr:Uma2 family endonuclease [Acidobacteriota bacterium]
MNGRPTSTITTADELLRLPDDGFRYELVNGELRRMTPSGYPHGVIVMNVTAPLHQHVRKHGLGQICAAETGFRIGRNPDTVRAPDAAFVRSVRQGGQSEGFYEGAPDLAVEVLSPSDTVFEVEEKVAQWLRSGCTTVWVVNPRQRSVTVHNADGSVEVLTEADTLEGGELLPGFLLPVAEIFRW